MEVHHHPDIRTKNLKEYFFEGLMIFMAVTLGFFAEKIRENLTERAKEKEFIESMIEDARKDITDIEEAIALNNGRVFKLDTIANACFNYGRQGNDDASMYKVIKFCIRHPDFVSPVERTMMQLKNSGGMRLINNAEAVNSIILYDNKVKKLINQQDYYELHLKVLLDATEQLFNLKCYPLNPETMLWESNPDSLAAAKLINRDIVKITEFGNKAKIFQGIVLFYIVRLEETKIHANHLIETLEREYDLGE